MRTAAIQTNVIIIIIIVYALTLAFWFSIPTFLFMRSIWILPFSPRMRFIFCQRQQKIETERPRTHMMHDFYYFIFIIHRTYFVLNSSECSGTGFSFFFSECNIPLRFIQFMVFYCVHSFLNQSLCGVKMCIEWFRPGFGCGKEQWFRFFSSINKQ